MCMCRMSVDFCSSAVNNCRCTCKQLRSQMKVASTEDRHQGHPLFCSQVGHSGDAQEDLKPTQCGRSVHVKHTNTYPISGRTHRTSSVSPLREPRPPTPAPVTPRRSDSGLPESTHIKDN